jgi:hypothetical protein
VLERSGGRPASVPGYADIRWADVWADAESLVVRLELNGASPSAIEPGSTLRFLVLLDRDGDRRADHRLVVSSADGWTVRVWDVSTRLAREAGTARLGASDLRFRVPLAWIAFRGVVRYQVVVRWRDGSQAAPSSVTEDRIPDRDGRWIRVVGVLPKP